MGVGGGNGVGFHLKGVHRLCIGKQSPLKKASQKDKHLFFLSRMRGQAALIAGFYSEIVICILHNMKSHLEWSLLWLTAICNFTMVQQCIIGML